MRTTEHLVRLKEELKYIKWVIVGICETRLPEEKDTVF